MAGLLSFLFVIQGILIYSIFAFVFSKQNSIARVHKYFENHEEKSKRINKNQGLRQVAKSFGEKFSSVIFLRSYQKYLKKELERANIKLKVDEIIAFSMILSIISPLYYSVSKNVGMSIIILVMAWLFPLLLISSKKKKRLLEINNQLNDLLILLSNSLKAGYSFLQAVEISVKEMPEPVSYELARMLREMNLGITTEDALNNLGERVISKDLDMVITAILIQRQVGGNLAEVLDNISQTIRERIKIKGEIKTATAQGRMSGVIISLLPVFLTIIFFVINPSYIMKLFTTIPGIIMLITGIIMEIIGMVLIKKIITIDI